MTDPRLRRSKANARRETDADTIRFTAVKVKRVCFTIPIDICVLDLVWSRLTVLYPHLCRFKSNPFRQANPNASAPQRVEVQRVGCSVSIDIRRLNLIR